MFVNQRFQLLQAQTEDLDICQCFHIYIHDLIYEKRSEIDTSSRSEFINYKVVVLKLGRNFDFSLLDEEDGSDLVLLLHDHMILLEVLGSQAEDKIKHHEVRCFTEVVDATNHIRKSLESVVFVWAHDLLFETLFILWVILNESLEKNGLDKGECIVV